LSRARLIATTVAAVALRNLIPYGLASVVAALIVVTGISVSEAYQGRTFGLDNFAVAAFYGSLATFVFALPASAVLIGIGEWRKLGTWYHVAAGSLAAVISLLVVFLDFYLDGLRGEPRPFLRAEDVILLSFAAVGGAVGGLVFVQARRILLGMLGPLAFGQTMRH
jgi:hypothetical protein